MNFTLVFESNESEDLSIKVCFIPCICWLSGTTIISNPHPETPQYQKGDLEFFLTTHGYRPTGKHVVLIIHSLGNGTQNDLDLLIDDLTKLDFAVRTIKF